MKGCMRVIALFCALILLTGGAARGEETSYEAAYLADMNMAVEDWLATAESRAFFAVLFMLEVSGAKDTGFGDELDLYGFPTLYLISFTASQGYALSLLMRFGEGDSAWLCTYDAVMGAFTVRTVEASGDAALYLALLEAGGVVSWYGEIPFSDVGDAIDAMNAIFE